jgi:hypothetical protein
VRRIFLLTIQKIQTKIEEKDKDLAKKIELLVSENK